MARDINEIIKEINEFSKKAKTVGLSEEEKVKRESVRREYISLFKGNLEAQLDSIYLVDDKGNKSKLKKGSGK